jgi:hypothetical protein
MNLTLITFYNRCAAWTAKEKLNLEIEKTSFLRRIHKRSSAWLFIEGLLLYSRTFSLGEQEQEQQQEQQQE